MLALVWKSARGFRLRPWRSPYLRWRIETFAGLQADQIGFREFWGFLWRERAALRRYLHWAGSMDAAAQKPALK